MAKYDAVIVGGGISGMSAAILLAQAGRRVALVEQSSRLGPLLRSFHRQGYRFDPGFHFSGTLDGSGVLSVFLRMLGVWDDLAFERFDDDVIHTMHFLRRGRVVRIPGGFRETREALKRQFPADATAVDGYFDAIDEVIVTTPTIDPARSPQRLIRNRYDAMSLQDVVDSLRPGADARALLLRHATRLYGVPPSLTPFRFHGMLSATMFPGMRRIRGGGEALVCACEKQLARLGVELRLGSPVTAIDVDDQRALRGVELATGERLETETCIATINPRLLLSLLPERAAHPAYRTRLRELKESAAFFCVYLGLNKPLPSVRRGVFEWAPEADGDHVYDGAVPPEQRGFLLIGSGDERPCTGILMRYASDDEFAPWAGSGLGARPAAYVDYKRRQAEILLARATQALPELKDCLDYWIASTPLTLEAYTRSPGGSAYGVAHRTDQRNPEIATRTRGLLLAGQGILAPGVCGAIVSSYYACGFLLNDGTLQRRFSECVKPTE